MSATSAEIDVAERQERHRPDEGRDAQDEVGGGGGDVDRQAQRDDQERHVDDAAADAEDARHEPDEQADDHALPDVDR